MRIAIDGAGRLVVSKELRRRLSLSGGEALATEERDGHIEIRRPESDEPLATTYLGLLTFADGRGHDAGVVRELLETSRR